jgi:hypothetical protein
MEYPRAPAFRRAPGLGDGPAASRRGRRRPATRRPPGPACTAVTSAFTARPSRLATAWARPASSRVGPPTSPGRTRASVHATPEARRQPRPVALTIRTPRIWSRAPRLRRLRFRVVRAPAEDWQETETVPEAAPAARVGSAPRMSSTSTWPWASAVIPGRCAGGCAAPSRAARRPRGARSPSSGGGRGSPASAARRPARAASRTSGNGPVAARGVARSVRSPSGGTDARGR